MYKRALAGLGLGVMLSHAAAASPKSKTSETTERGAHVHRGETKKLRSASWMSTYRKDDLASDLKRSIDAEGEKPRYVVSSTGEVKSKDGGSTKSYESSSKSYESGSKSYESSSKGSGRSSEGGSSYSSSYSSRPSVKVVTSGTDTGLSSYAIRPAVFGGSKGGTYEQERTLRELGRLIAKAKWPLLTGGGNGMPQIAQKAAFEEGGYTVGFGQADSLSDHRSSGRPADHLSVLYTTGTGRGPGTIEREAPLAEQTNVGIFAGGSIGTLGELMASLYKPGVLAFLKGSGGVADAAVKKILPHLGPLPKNVRIVEDSDPQKLLIASMIELDRLKGEVDFPKSHVNVGHREVFKAPEEVRRTMNVVSYLVDAQGMSAGDRGRLKRLTNRLHSEKIDGKPPVVVVPDRGGLSEEIANDAAAAGVATFNLSHLGPRSTKSLGEKHTRVFLDKGEGVGESAAGREVTQDARVVVVAGGDYKTLSGLIYALHHDTIVAVLETGGMSGALRSDIMPVIADKTTRAKVIYGSDPDELFASIKRELSPKVEIKETKSWRSYSRDSDERSSWE